MPRTTTRRISALLVTAAILALSVQPAAAAGRATPMAPASRSVDRLWSWVAEIWGTLPGMAAARGTAGPRRPAVLTGKLGGFLDPNGARFLSEPAPTTDLHP
jgi:hypothetical protein